MVNKQAAFTTPGLQRFTRQTVRLVQCNKLILSVPVLRAPLFY